MITWSAPSDSGVNTASWQDARAGAPEREVSMPRSLAVRAIFFLLVLSVVPWTSDSLFGGGIDPVDVAKALVAITGLALATALAIGTKKLVPVGAAPSAIVIVILLISLLGAIVAGHGAATFVVVARVLIAMVTVLLLLSSVPWNVGVSAFLSAMAVLAALAAITGLPSLAIEGRLAGGLPQIHPNELAGLAGLPLVGAVIWILRRGLRVSNAAVVVGLAAVVVATGSRTGLLAVAVSILVAVLLNGIHQRAVLFILLGSLPVGYSVVLFTDAFEGLATRAGSTDTTSSLESRFDAWRVVLGWGSTTWQRWIGIGLSEKTVPVDIEYRDVQVLDSSWVSILAQAGALGTFLLMTLVAWTVVAAWAAGRRRPWILPLLVLLLMRSVTESGLMDAATPFVTLLVLSSVLTRRSRHDGVGVEPAGTGAATIGHDSTSRNMGDQR